MLLLQFAIFLHAVSDLLLALLRSGMYGVILDRRQTYIKEKSWQILCLPLEYVKYKRLISSKYIAGTNVPALPGPCCLSSNILGLC